MDYSQKFQQVCEWFRIDGKLLRYEVISAGNVNQTFRIDCVMRNGEDKSFLIQKVNTYAFRDPVALMENVDRVSEFIHQIDIDRTCLHYHHTADRKSYVVDGVNFWRLTNYIPSVSYNSVDDLEIIHKAGKAFGDFQNMLASFPIDELTETIPDFHNTRKRYENLRKAIANDKAGMVSEVQEEIDYLMSVEDYACKLTDLQIAGLLPTRVTHNDTKLNNVLFCTKKPDLTVVIDLDTVMPGLIGHDFGDAIRFAANFVEEDSKEPEYAGVNLEVFKAFAEGFLSAVGEKLTQMEIDTLALSCFALTVELATRFLEDYLNGNPYFKTLYPEHNLVRTRCQIALSKDMMSHMQEMDTIIKECVYK